MEYIAEQMEIDGARDEEDNMEDYSLQDILIVMVTIKFNLI